MKWLSLPLLKAHVATGTWPGPSRTPSYRAGGGAAACGGLRLSGLAARCLVLPAFLPLRAASKGSTSGEPDRWKKALPWVSEGDGSGLGLLMEPPAAGPCQARVVRLLGWGHPVGQHTQDHIKGALQKGTWWVPWASIMSRAAGLEASKR